jgi:DNA-binding response OmpR family regulator
MSTRTRVLLIEDDVAMREMLCTVLGEAGLEVVSLEGATAALQLFQDEPRALGSFDLVITDEHMPGLRGTELARWLARRASPPVLLLSGCSPRELEAAGRLVGVGQLEILTKPVPLSVLLERVGALLGLQVLL